MRFLIIYFEAESVCNIRAVGDQMFMEKQDFDFYPFLTKFFQFIQIHPNFVQIGPNLPKKSFSEMRPHPQLLRHRM